VERFGQLDVCVANAGIAPAAATVRAMDDEVFDRVVAVNLLGVHRTVMAALPHVIERRGHISIVSSIYAFMNGMLVAPYAVTKAGVEQLGRALRVELAPHGVTVGVVYYGYIDTAMVRQGFEADALATRLETEHVPAIFRRRLSAEQAARVLVRGVERRSPRVAAPRWLGRALRLRGVLGPAIDRRLATDTRLRELLREADDDRRVAGRGIVG
jgi:NAD(P)-dependent dehydrogenase (short-subunit alcohol dehydrogenase family)